MGMNCETLHSEEKDKASPHMEKLKTTLKYLEETRQVIQCAMDIVKEFREHVVSVDVKIEKNYTSVIIVLKDIATSTIKKFVDEFYVHVVSEIQIYPRQQKMEVYLRCDWWLT